MTTATTEPPANLDEAREQAAALAGPDAPTPAKPKARKARKARKRTPSTPAADRAPRAPRPPALAKRLEAFISGLGAMLLIINPADGQLIIAGAEKQAAALDALAKENDAVRRALEKLLTASVYGQLLAAFAPTLLGLAANHGMVPPMVGTIVGAAMTPPPADAGEPSVDLAALAAMLAQQPSPNGGPADGAPFGAIVGMG